jgi:transposase
VVTSDGKTFENIKIKRNNQKKLNKLHKQLSKKQRGSKNRNKARIKLAKFQEVSWSRFKEWVCPVCGAHHDRDLNAAINIKNEGIKKLNLEVRNKM